MPDIAPRHLPAGDSSLAASDTLLDLAGKLPLTCSRRGSCCHGKAVWINPWELACLAQARAIQPQPFRKEFATDGGIRLRMNGDPGWRNLPACSQYAASRGCLAHLGRPLACRLYPLGRRRQNEEEQYFHEGGFFPCMDSCREVMELPHLSVAEYLSGQGVTAGAAAQDAYLKMVGDLAEGALVLLLDSGLAASGDRETIPAWRRLGSLEPAARAANIPGDWLDLLTVPEISLPDNAAADKERALAFVAAHHEILQTRAQTDFSQLNQAAALRKASCLMLALALHLGQSLGAEPGQITAKFVATALRNGAKE